MDSEGVPRATMEAFRMVLSMDDATPVWNLVPALGFSSVQVGSSGSSYVLGMNAALQNAGASWIHSRNLSDGGTQVSTQRMKVVSDLMALRSTTPWTAASRRLKAPSMKAPSP